MTNCFPKEMEQDRLVRLLDSSSAESIARVTELLNLSYRARASKGVDYLPDGQDVETTHRRIAGKEVWVYEIDGQMVGTYTLTAPGKASGTWWYRQAGVAEISQVAVHPAYRMLGVFGLLMDSAERRAVEIGSRELAGSVPTKRKKLVKAYLSRGGRIVDYKWKENARYGSIIWSKSLGENPVRSRLWRRVSRRVRYFRRYVRYELLRKC